MNDILRKIGLTQSEIAVYLALLELGATTTGPLIKEASIASGKAYLVLDKLIAKGLVTYTVRHARKEFHAKDPARLLEYHQQLQQEQVNVAHELEQLIPWLQEKYHHQQEKVFAEVYEGLSAFKTFHKLMLDQVQKGDTIYVFGVPREANERYNTYFQNWNVKRVEKEINLCILYNSDNKTYGKQRSMLAYTQVRYMKDSQQTPAWVDVFGNHVATLSIQGTPRCFLIKDKAIAQSYLQYFLTLWNQADIE